MGCYVVKSDQAHNELYRATPAQLDLDKVSRSFTSVSQLPSPILLPYAPLPATQAGIHCRFGDTPLSDKYITTTKRLEPETDHHGLKGRAEEGEFAKRWSTMYLLSSH